MALNCLYSINRQFMTTLVAMPQDSEQPLLLPLGDAPKEMESHAKTSRFVSIKKQETSSPKKRFQISLTFYFTQYSTMTKIGIKLMSILYNIMFMCLQKKGNLIKSNQFKCEVLLK